VSGTGADLLREGVRALTEAGVPQAAQDARWLLADALGVGRDRLTLVLSDPVGADQAEAFRHLVARRARREPVSQILGRRVFYGREFRVTRDVLDPRPETEMLVEAALAEPFEALLDLGTGSGCIALTLLAEMEGSRAVATDVSPAALAVAEANAERLGLRGRVQFLQSDWYGEVTGLFDLIVSNPPYIAADEVGGLAPEVRDWEPRGALTDETDGLAAYRVILALARRYLLPGGRVLVEIGPTQARAVVDLAALAGFGEVRVIRDMDGRDRVISAFFTDS
jgi:release factor glutamine methyltransferase